MARGRPESPTQTRAGRYVLQPAGYRAFVPAPLPPDPPVQLRGQLRKLLSQADRALGRLDGSVQTLPNPDLFVFMYVRKEAVLAGFTQCYREKPFDDILRVGRKLDHRIVESSTEVYDSIGIAQAKVR